MEEAERIDEASLLQRAMAIIPGGTSTGSKRHATMFGPDAGEDLPSHYISASGCELTLPDGSSIVDCTMALGSVAIGYGDELVSHAVMAAVRDGNVAAFPPALELDIAERLADVIPIAERVRFLKTGAEGTAAAVRLARAATGRSGVIGSGYFGWLDWCNAEAGVPDAVRAGFSAVPFNDVKALESAARNAGANLAAIIIEPVVNHLADEIWVKKARELCDALGAVLIFDEVKTGFRLRVGGYQEMSGIAPDLAVFGKAMANGYPLAAVVGRAGVMDEAERTWISSTLACETTALAAAGAVLEWHERAEVCESLWTIGDEMRRAVSGAIESSGVDGVTVTGIDPMWSLHFDDASRQDRFIAHAFRNGVLFKRGPYNFPCLSHEESAVREIEIACSTALVQLLEEEAGGFARDEDE
jgi:glutamate-1-semialdehyde aminotransferase